jgi:hypothetical protein
MSEGDLAELRAGTHLPHLAACLVETGGAVLEIGRGSWSTPWLWRYCAAASRLLLSVDDAPQWVAAWPEFPGHIVNYDEFVPQAAARPWGVVLLDHSPGERRAADAMALRHVAERIVVHDMDRRSVSANFTPEILGHWPIRRLDGSTLVLVR